MVVAVFVIAHGGHVHDLRYHVGSDDWPFRTFFARLVSGKRPRGGFKDRQCFSRIASGHTHDFVNGSSLILTSFLSPRSLSMALLMSVFRSSGSSDSSLTTTDRLNNGLMMEKLGFSWWPQ